MSEEMETVTGYINQCAELQGQFNAKNYDVDKIIDVARKLLISADEAESRVKGAEEVTKEVT